MTSTINLRLTSFGLAIGLLAGLIGWVTYVIWLEVAKLEHFDSAQISSYQVADHIQDTILKLYNILADYELKEEKADLDAYRKASAELDAYIDKQKDALREARQSELLNKIDAEYDRFMATVSNVVAQVQRNQGPDSKLVGVQKINAASEAMFQLGYNLEEEHQKALKDSFDESRKSLAMLQPLLIGSLFVLLALGTSLFIMIYRDMIAPLRIKLVESSVIIERQEKLASLGMLAAGVAHEIRNPLTAIKARLFMQGKQLKHGSPEHADAEVIGQEINRLERIVRDFLLFARPSEPELRIIPAEEPLREAQELLGAQLQKSNIKIHLETSPPARIRIDPQQIKQVIINLVQNAAESIGQDGSITLRSRRDTRLLGDRQVAVAVLEITDTGKGMSPEVEKRLFDPFFTTKESGTGLGLPIAARIVEKHGGVLQYQTQINHGTTFGVVLPRVEADERTA